MSFLVLAYNRLENLRKLIESLKVIDEKIYISIDGGSSKDCLKVQNYCIKLRNENPKKYILQQLDQNNGVKNGVIKGMDWFFSMENAGIILEEDLELLIKNFQVVSQNVLKFVKSNKNAVINLSSFKHQSNDKLPKKYIFQAQNDFFMWGWSCHKQTWLEFKVFLNAPNYQAFFNSEFVATLKEKFYWMLIIRLLRLSQIDSWGYYFLMYTVTNKTNYAPEISSIRNGGLSRGSNFSRLSIYDDSLSLNRLEQYEITKIEIHKEKSFGDVQREKLIRHNINFLAIGRLLFWNFIPIRRIIKNIIT